MNCRNFRNKTNGITFVIPNWNHRFYLSRSVGSSVRACRELSRLGVPSEIIIVDDASRDGSQRFICSLIALYSDINISCCFNENNLGLPASRNLALNSSRYKFCCMLDADNSIAPLNMYSFYSTALKFNAAMVYGNIITIENGQPVSLSNHDIICESLFCKNYIDAMSLVNSEIILSAGGYSVSGRVKGVEDWELVSHLFAENQTIVFVPILFGYYYREKLSMLSEGFPKEITRMFHQRKHPLFLSNNSHFMYHPAFDVVAS
ncbi:glycosyltransferase family 2 protein [Fundidesulfovibrio agrisoli]|uniref:glycosyltransferase family 2 protein n=1 Tax=Fundidesulfovibrio agrisoli TaxID=2922717 RepID=UPI001FAE2881|nr:glycosyltransferase family A protein [Fundidesulfovibrio agrisoli]